MADPIVPLTKDQLRYLSEQTERAAKHAVRYYRNRAAAAFAVLALSVLGAFYVDTQHNEAQHQANRDARAAIVDSGRATVTVGCNRDFRQTAKFREFVARSSGQIDQYVAEGTLTPEQGKRAKKENRRFLSEIKLPDCRAAQDSLTQNPNEKITVPDPLYPGSDSSKHPG